MRTRLVFILFILTILPIRALAQQTDTFVHTIRQGETVYSIARTYGVSPDEIIRLNPSAAEGIKAGAELVIPQKQSAQSVRYHTIQAGETLYRLTKTYNVSAEAICNANPGLTADNFRAGMVILIPAPDETAQASETESKPQGVANSGCREMYKVKRKETIYSIARQFRLTEAELVEANPEMKNLDYKLKKGSFICIPFSKQQTKTEKKEVVPTNEELINRNKKAASPQRTVSMGVILPFKGGSQENKKMIEFYRGVLMAANDMKDAGLSVDLFAYDSGKSAADMEGVLSAHPLTGLDVIIGPLYAEQAATLSDYCKKNQIRLVIPFTSHSESFYQNPYCFAVNPPKSYFHTRAAELTLRTFKNAQIIILKTDQTDDDAQLFIQALTSQCSQSGIKVTNVSFNDDEMTWLAAMNQYKDNLIIPNVTSVKALNQLFPKLKEFTESNPEYDIKLVGYPEWQTYVSNHLDNFYKYDTYVFSSFFRNPLAGSNAEQFENAYQKNFRTTTLVTWPRFGMLGYDIAYYFMKGLYNYGDAMDAHLGNIITSPYQHDFLFRRINNWGGFINERVQFIHYTPSHEIYLIK